MGPGEGPSGPGPATRLGFEAAGPGESPGIGPGEGPPGPAPASPLGFEAAGLGEGPAIGPGPAIPLGLETAGPSEGPHGPGPAGFEAAGLGEGPGTGPGEGPPNPCLGSACVKALGPGGSADRGSSSGCGTVAKRLITGGSDKPAVLRLIGKNQVIKHILR